MRLTSLDITGFKSFAKHVSLKFQSGNTAIVGPNGSGKSNIADAIRWALGEQSMKTLRGKKLEDVIYAGGTTRGRLGMAEVSLTLENDENSVSVLDAPEVVITRRLYRSGESAYLVNNRPVRLLDVGEILAKAGFAQKTYTVIGQGMADSFVNATPVERRAMFEDATGVTSLLIKKEQTERKLEQAKENITRAKDHLSELEPRLRSLKRQAVRARQREEVEKELRTKEEKWFSYNWLNYKTIIDESDGKLAMLHKAIKECEEKISKLQPKHAGEDLGYRLPELRSGFEKLRQEEQDISIKLAKAGNGSIDDINRRAEAINSKEKERRELVNVLEEVENELRQQENILTQTREGLRNAQEALLKSQVGGRVDVRIDDIQKRTKEALELQDSLIRRLSKIDDLSDLIILREDAGRIRVVLQQLIKILENDEQGDVSSFVDLQAKLNEISQKKETLESRITSEKIKQAKLEMQLKSAEERLAEMSHHESLGNKKTEEASLNKRLDEIRAQKEGFQREIEMLESSLFSSFSEQQKINKELDDARQKMHTAEQEKYSEEVRVAGTIARKEDMEREIAERVGQEFMSRLQNNEIASPQDFSTGEVDQEIRQLRKKIELIGGIDPNVIQEETEVEKRVNELTEQLDDLDKTGVDMRAALRDLDKHIHRQFSEGMKNINETFNVYFRQVFGGGKAGLSVIKSQSVVHEAQVENEDEDGEEEGFATEEHIHELPSGVEIKANPPGKKLGSIAQLSGGEKALTSVALLFAIISQRNSPFIVLDEVDAALDEANSRRFSRMLKELSNKTQFLVITHNRATMESANALYGVTMQEEGVSQLLSVKLSDVPEEFVAEN